MCRSTVAVGAQNRTGIESKRHNTPVRSNRRPCCLPWLDAVKSVERRSPSVAFGSRKACELSLLDGPPVILSVPSMLGPGVRPPRMSTLRAPWPDGQPEQPQAAGIQEQKPIQIPAATEHVPASQAVPASTGHRVPPAAQRPRQRGGLRLQLPALPGVLIQHLSSCSLNALPRIIFSRSSSTLNVNIAAFDRLRRSPTP